MPVRIAGNDRTAQSTWETPRARAVFELFLEQRDGVAPADLRELLAPDESLARKISPIHAAMSELEKTLYDGCIVRQNGSLRLDPNVAFKVA